MPILSDFSNYFFVKIADPGPGQSWFPLYTGSILQGFFSFFRPNVRSIVCQENPKTFFQIQF